jgi:dTDP-4-dehydrorhamnose reductase
VNILVTGAQGQLGTYLLNTLLQGRDEWGPLPEVYQHAHVDAVDKDELDITQATALDAWFEMYGPYDLVFNCAAFTNVDGCETNTELAFAINAEGPANLAKACARTNTTLVHVSTDYVFPGNEPGERKETDQANPLSAYGKTKLEGEKAVLVNNPRTHVVRTAWLYGPGGKNFVNTMLALGAAHKEITVVDDQYGNPTSVADLTHEMLRLALTSHYGVWHATCEGVCSWAQFAQAIMDEAGLACRVKPCTSAQWKEMNPASAERPAYSALAHQKFIDTIGYEMRPWRVALMAFMSSQNEQDTK